MSNQRRTLTASVDGTPAQVTVDLFDGEAFAIHHIGREYLATGKTGTRFDSGAEVLEFATESDARLWATPDATAVWMD